uniref:F-box domain-containing protein n=1 Tax=Mycena chlorophos TaxID=658473 RepID=A0ABQ0LV89_MYCCL|nr:predicted protein [Mycena chlorophos]
MLQSLPPELVRLICAFACTDTGTTGRALSLVSRYVHNASAAVKLQSIALAGYSQLSAFAEFLDNSPGVSPGTVSLYITMQGLEVAKLTYSVRRRLAQDGGRHLQKIFHRVSDTLEVLHLFLKEDLYYELNQTARIDLPHLVELKTGGGFPVSVQRAGNIIQLTATLQPSLKLTRLHIVESIGYYAVHFLDPKVLASFAPNLVSLRCSRLYVNQVLPIQVAQSMGFEDSDLTAQELVLLDSWNAAHWHPETRLNMPKSVKDLVFQLQPLRPKPPLQSNELYDVAVARQHEEQVAEYAEMRDAVQRLAVRCKARDRDVRVVLLEPEPQEDLENPDVFLQEWFGI